jgi:hypothetical protein
MPKCSNSRFSVVVAWYRFVVATLVAGYAARTTKAVTTNPITGIAGLNVKCPIAEVDGRAPGHLKLRSVIVDQVVFDGVAGSGRARVYV